MYIKLVFKNQKPQYKEVSDSVVEEFKSSPAEYSFLKYDGKRFEFAGMMMDKIHVFKEVDLLEVKLAQLASRLMKSARPDLADLIPNNEVSVDEFINQALKVTTKDRRAKELLELKDSVYPKDKAKFQVLYNESKRDKLRQIMKQYNIATDPQQRDSFLNKVLEELNNRITKAIQDYRDFPDED